MKKMNFKLAGKEMLSKEQMKKVSGGGTHWCEVPNLTNCNCHGAGGDCYATVVSYDCCYGPGQYADYGSEYNCCAEAAWDCNQYAPGSYPWPHNTPLCS